MATKSNPNYTLTGRISNPQREPLAGLTVRAYDQDSKSPDDLLDEATTDKDGRYQIRFSEAQFKPGGKKSGRPDVYIRVYDGDEMVKESLVHPKAGREEPIDLKVELPEPAELEEPAFSVSGTVRQSDGRPFPHVLVRAFDQGLREHRSKLGESKTDSDGRYTIGYKPEKLLDPERGSANLVVELESRNDAVPPRSEIRFNARRNEIIDLTADPDGQASEWERLMARLQPTLKGLAIADLTDEELAFITNSRRLDPKQLQPVAQAARAAEKSQFPDWFHYALIRQGLPAELDALLETSVARIQQALDTSRKANIIAPEEEELAALQQGFARRQAGHILDKLLPGHRLEARKLFTLAGLDQEEQQTLARTLVGQDSRGLDGSLIIPSDSGLDDATVERLRFTLRLARLVDDHEGVLQGLVNDKHIQSERDLAIHFDPEDWEKVIKQNDKAGKYLPEDLPGVDLRLMTLSDKSQIPEKGFRLVTVTNLKPENILHLRIFDISGKNQLDKSETDFPKKSSEIKALKKLLTKSWDEDALEPKLKEIILDKIRSIIGHTYLPGESPEDRRSAYARRIYTRAVAAYPTVATAYGLSRREGLKQDLAIKLLPKLVETDEKFDLASVRLDPYIKDRRKKMNLTEEDIKPVTERLKGVQRLYRLRPHMLVIARLLEDKVDSAMAIAHYGKGKFIGKYGTDPAFGRETALALYQSAERIATRALGVYAHYSPSINTSPRPAAIEECPVALKGVPNIPTLFGSLDGCACEPCESVYSPAAYLTDLLAFLERSVEKPKDVDWPVPDNGLEALAGRSYCNAANELQTRTRRPDIFLTLLSCRNAETEMPYVDLVLEILERAVAADGSDEVLQTNLPANQLAAQPEHFNEKAYETLGKAVFPFSLPFDLWHEEETIYLEKLGTSRAEVLETFYPFESADDLSVFADGKEPQDLTEIRRWQDTAIAQARLGLSDNAWRLIAGQPIPPAQTIVAAELWGYSSGGSNWWHPLRIADKLMTRSGLEYKDLLRLLRLRSFNPTGAIGIANDNMGACDPKEINLKGLSAAALGFLHRLLRLQRALGWSLREMDQTLLSLAPPSSNNGRPALDEAFLVRLSHLVRLREKFGLPLDKLLSWWSPLETRDYRVPQLPHEQVSPSLYERLFLSGRAGEAEFEAFQLNAGHMELKNSNKLLNNHLSPIAGVLGLTLPDLQLLVDNLKAGLVHNSQGQNRLTLANLSLLFRHASLARALGLKIEEYLTLKTLIPFDPFLTAQLAADDPLSGTLQTLRFVERVKAVRESGFSIAELDYLLRQATPFVGKTVAPTEEWVHESLTHIKENLLTLPIAVSTIALLHEMLELLDTDSPSEIPLDDVRLLLEEALSAFEANGGDQTQEFQETQQLVRDAQELVAPDEAFTDAKQGELREKISEALDYYENILYRLQAESLQLALAEILSLPVAVCKILLELTPLPADPTQMAVEVFLSAWLSPPPVVAEGADSSDGNGSNGSGAAATPAASEQNLTELLYRLHKAALVIGRLGIQAHELVNEEGRARYLNVSEAAGWLDVTRLPVRDAEPMASIDAWMRTVQLFHFRDVLPAEQQEHLFDLFASSDKESFIGELHKIQLG